MCGRYTLRTPAGQIAEAFGLADVPFDVQPRFNIAPTQEILAVKLNEQQRREFALLRWGLIPSWADDPKIGSRMINARGESVRIKPSFRNAFQRSRCLVVADGFYEWVKQQGTKQPMLIEREDGCPFAFAGLWELWRKGVQPIHSCTIITTDANDFIRQVHDRMPVILSPDQYDPWLNAPADVAEQMIQTSSTAGMKMTPVGKLVDEPATKRSS